MTPLGNNLYKIQYQYPTFHTDNFTYSLGGSVKSLHLNDPSMDAVVLGNFDILTKSVDPKFQQTGVWYEFFTGDSITVSDPNATLSLLPGEYKIYTTVITHVIGVSEWDSPTAPALLVYPNPAEDHLFLNSSSEYVMMSSFELLDGLGRRIQSGDLEFAQKAEIHVGSLPEGMYYLKVLFSNGLSTVEKVMVK